MLRFGDDVPGLPKTVEPLMRKVSEEQTQKAQAKQTQPTKKGAN